MDMGGGSGYGRREYHYVDIIALCQHNAVMS